MCKVRAQRNAVVDRGCAAAWTCADLQSRVWSADSVRWRIDALANRVPNEAVVLDEDVGSLQASLQRCVMRRCGEIWRRLEDETTVRRRSVQ